jgi:hypothetical protein
MGSAAVLLDVGEVDAAVDIAAAGAARAHEPVACAVSLDTAVGVYLAAGRVAEARTALGELRALHLEGGDLAATFRQAQLDRLAGDLGPAVAGFEAIVAATEGFPAAAGAEAAAWTELAEVHELRHALTRDADALEAAHTAIVSAAEAWQRARRRSGRLRSDAWEARVDRKRGFAVAPGHLHRAIGFAQERQLVALEADLRCSLAVATADPSEAARAVALLDGFPLARGRARVAEAEAGGAADLSAALAELVDDLPWSERARRLLT